MIKHFLTAVLALASSLVAGIAHGAVTLSPPSPTPMDTISISKPYDNEDSTKTVISMSGNHITVTLYGLDVYFPEPPPGTLVQPIGRYPAGTYQVDVMYGAGTTPIASFTITVAPRAAGLPVDDYSDIWWNPNESGWGLNVAQHAAGQLFATWFVYAADGSPTWYVMPGGHWTAASVFEGDIYRTTGPVVGVTFDPALVTRAKVGTAQLLVGVNGTMTAIFTIDGRLLTKTLQRQSF